MPQHVLPVEAPQVQLRRALARCFQRDERARARRHGVDPRHAGDAPGVALVGGVQRDHGRRLGHGPAPLGDVALHGIEGLRHPGRKRLVDPRLAPHH
ncbi:MAG: hypothetical protein ACK56F_15490, partial [bacterium]